MDAVSFTQLTRVFLSLLALSFPVSFCLIKNKIRSLDGWIVASLPQLLLTCLLWLTLIYLRSPVESLTTLRLYPSYLMMHGFPIYPTAHDGILQSAIYGPIGRILFTPIVLANKPWDIAHIAIVINVIFLLAPAAWGCFSQNKKGWQAIFLFLFFCAFVMQSSSMRSITAIVHADAAGIFFVFLAAALISRSKKQISDSRILAAAVFAALAVWTKQTMAALFIPIFYFCFRWYGIRPLFKLVGYAVVVLFLLGALFAKLFSLEGLLWNLIICPAKHGFAEPFHDALFFNLKHLFFEILFPVSILWFISLRYRQKAHVSESGSLSALCFWIAISMIPLGLLGALKKGGDINNFSQVAYFLAGAVTFKMKHVLESEDTAALGKMMMMGVILCVYLTQLRVNLFIARHPERNVSLGSVAYHAIKESPGKYYFPEFTLEHFLVEKKPYHQTLGFMDRFFSQVPLSKEHRDRYLPSGAEKIVLRNNDGLTVLWLETFGIRLKKDQEQVIPGFTTYKKMDDLTQEPK